MLVTQLNSPPPPILHVCPMGIYLKYLDFQSQGCKVVGGWGVTFKPDQAESDVVLCVCVCVTSQLKRQANEIGIVK
jgi:hypothetical protein